MTETTAEDQEWFNPGQSNGDQSSTTKNYASIADAEDYAKFIRKPRTAVSKEYELRIKALLKAGVFGSINTGNLPDAAAIIHYGPDWAIAAGDLADADPWVRRGLDLITTPANPYGMFLVASIPFFAQLFRNHEEKIREVPVGIRARRAYRKQHPQEFEGSSVGLKLPFGRRLNFHLRFKVRNPFKMFVIGAKAQTHNPEDLALKVFSDPKLRTALERQGIRVQVMRDDE
jgi:hypothetical protein